MGGLSTRQHNDSAIRRTHLLKSRNDFEGKKVRGFKVRLAWRCSRAWLLALALTGAAWPLQAVEPEESLPELLRGLDRASRLYLDSVLRFSCDETITESGGKQSIHKFSYIYIYDDKKGFVDYRTARGRRAERPVDPGKFGIRYLQRSYFWVLIFHKTRQPVHRYQLAGREFISGREAVKVSFEPLKPYKEGLNDWYGIAWVDTDTFQLLLVEAMKVEDHAAFVQMKEDRANIAHMRSIPLERLSVAIESVSTDFSVVKNGMRFPGKTEIRITRYHVSLTSRPGRGEDAVVEDRTLQSYSHYLFFGVRTTDEVSDILSGPGANRPSP